LLLEQHLDACWKTVTPHEPQIETENARCKVSLRRLNTF